MHRRGVWILAWLIVCHLPISLARAADEPLQPLSAVLRTFAQQRGLRLIYVSELTDDKQARMPRPDVPEDEALRLILADTALAFERLGFRTIRIFAAPPPAHRGREPPSSSVPGKTPGTPATAAAGEKLESVVVSAQFRTDPLQSTPLAISVISPDDIAARSMSNLADTGRMAPSTQLNIAGMRFGKSLQAFIRGVGQTDFNFALEPGVGTYIDDVYHPTVFGAVFDLLDLDRVEILRGPQGTLFGKNSIGGAIRLITTQPRGDSSGYVQVTHGSFDRLDVRGAFDASLIPDVLFARLAASAKRRDGYVDVLDYACLHPDESGALLRRVSGAGRDGCRVGTVGNEDVNSARLSLRWMPGVDVQQTLTADYMNDESGPPADRLLYIQPGAFDSFNASTAIPLYGVPYDSRFVTSRDAPSNYATFDNPASGVSYPKVDSVRHWGVSHTADWAPAPHVLLKSVLAYREYAGRFGSDQDGSPIAITGGDDSVWHHQLSAEARASGDSLNGRLQWTLGLFHFKSYNLYTGLADSGLNRLFWTQRDHIRSENSSLLAHGSYSITERVRVESGLRFTREDKVSTFQRDFGAIADPATGSLPPVPEDFARSGSVGYRRLDPRISLDYRWPSDVMTYISVATGFRAGGFSPRPIVAAQVTAFRPESLVTVELGAKSEWLDHAARVNVALFQSEYRDMQLTATTRNANGLTVGMVTNVGRARIRGVELELQTEPIAGLQLNSALSFIDYRNLDLGAALGVPGGPALDSVPARTPRWSGSLGARYSLPLTGGAALIFGVDGAFQTRTFSDAANNPLVAQGGYAICNARAVWQPAHASWSLGLSGHNIADRRYDISAFAHPSGFGNSQPARPREWSLSARYEF